MLVRRYLLILNLCIVQLRCKLQAKLQRVAEPSGKNSYSKGTCLLVSSYSLRPLFGGARKGDLLESHVIIHDSCLHWFYFSLTSRGDPIQNWLIFKHKTGSSTFLSTDTFLLALETILYMWLLDDLRSCCQNDNP